jgi:hypothetical protein
MKNILSMLFILITTTAKSQNYPQPNTNDSDPNLDKFVGTWLWQNGNSSLKLILKKENALMLFPENYFSDVMIGFHKFISNGSVIEDFSTFNTTNFSNKKWSIISGTDINNVNLLKGTIYHKVKNKSVKFEIEYLSPTQIKLVSLKDKPGTKISIGSQPAYDWSITLPQNIILTKQ